MPRKPTNIVMVFSPRLRLPEACIRLVEAVSPRIKLWNITDLIKSAEEGDPGSRERVGALLAEAEILYGYPPPRAIVARAPKLKWIQVPIAGVDEYMTPDVVASSVVVTNAKIHGTQMSEMVLCTMLMLARQSLQHFRFQQEKKWQILIPSILQRKTVGILGLGPIGQATARLAKAFGMRVVALRARPTIGCRCVDAIFPPSGLHELLAQSDFVVVLLPRIPETMNLIGEAEFRAMKPTAYLVNVARGGIVDEEALVRALTAGRIAGAGLDALTNEPLPTDSRLWDLPNVIITPHIAGERPDYSDLVTKQFCQNLKRYLSGRELLNIVDKTRRY